MQVLDAPKAKTIIPPLFSPLLRKYTLEEFWAIPEPPDLAHHELIGGVLFMAPPPAWPHGDFDERLNKSLVSFVTSHGNPGKIFHPRESIYTDDTYLEPDMMYASNELAAKMGKRRTCADIVFEYVSKTSTIYDYTTKADTYLALGVRELWLVDSDNYWIEVRYRVERDNSPAWHIVRFEKGDLAESRVLAGWRVSVDELFEDLV